jgi:hypothetical protein
VVVVVCAEWRKGRFNALTAIKALLRSRPFGPGGAREGEGVRYCRLGPRPALGSRDSLRYFRDGAPSRMTQRRKSRLWRVRYRLPLVYAALKQSVAWRCT